MSSNRGNFLEILKLVASQDPIVHYRLNDSTKNAAYTSPDIHNTLHNVMGNIVQNEICLAVNPLTIDDTFWSCQILTTCYQLVRSVLKISSALPERVEQGEVKGALL